MGRSSCPWMDVHLWVPLVGREELGGRLESGNWEQGQPWRHQGLGALRFSQKTQSVWE